jgi:hypothetical protein
VVIPKVAQPGEKHLPDYEVELTIVIGKPAKNVSEEDALDYILAYTGSNDVRHARNKLNSPLTCAPRSRSAITKCESLSGAFPKVSVSLLSKVRWGMSEFLASVR